MYITPFSGLDKGGQVSLFHLIKGLNKNKYSPILITPEDGDFAKKVRSLGFKTFYRSFKAIKPRNFIKIMKDLQWLRRLLREEEIDIIHSDRPRDTFQGKLASILSGIPVIWHVRMTNPDLTLDRVNKFYVDKIIGVSEATKQRFEGFGWKGDRYITIYNGVDLGLFEFRNDVVSKIKEKLIGKSESKIVTAVCQLVREKGVDDLIKAAAILRDNNINASFFIAGEGTDSDWERLRALIKELKLGDSVYLLGYRNDVPELLAASDLVVLASYYEGCPRVVLEAMAAKKAVVATDVSGTREVVTDETGILVPKINPDELASAIQKMLVDEKSRIKMGIAGRKRVEKVFDIRLNIEKIENVYEDLLTLNK